MKRLLILSSSFTCLTLAAQTATRLLPNPSFEEGEAHWSLADRGMSKVAPEAARSGRLGLRVADDSARSGSSCRSSPVPAAPGKTYALRFWARALDGVGAVGVYQQYFDAEGRNLTTPERNGEIIAVVPAGAADWRAFTLYGKAPAKAAALAVWIHAFDAELGKADLDDFSVEELSDQEAARVLRDGLLGSGGGFPAPDPDRKSVV